MIVPVVLAITLGTLTALSIAVPASISLVGRAIGWYLRNRTQQRRELLISRTNVEKSQADENSGSRSTTLDDEWEKVSQGRSQASTPEGTATSTAGRNEINKGYDGIIGFFHPFCNAGGGGERVLWAAIKATQLRYPNAICVVYTGDHDVSKAQMLKRVQVCFLGFENLQLSLLFVLVVPGRPSHIVIT